MEIEKIYQFVLLVIVVGMVLGVGILALDKFADAAQNDISVVNETVTTSSDTATLAYTSDVVVSKVYNGSSGGVIVEVTDYNYTSAGVITVAAVFADGEFNVTYAAEYDGAASDAAQATNVELGTVASTWLGLIVTIFVLAIIISMVVMSFGKPR